MAASIETSSEDDEMKGEQQPLLRSESGARGSPTLAPHRATINKSTNVTTTATTTTTTTTAARAPTMAISRERLFVVISILVTELCERLAFYSIVANMVLFCTSTLKLTSAEASNVTWIFVGTVYVTAVIGGYVADVFAGKYNTILGSGLIYVLGLFLLPVSAVNYTHWFRTEKDLTVEGRKVFFFLGLAFVAIGTGGIKPNVAAFGAMQVDDLGPEVVQSFFNWFYWSINVGAIVAYSGVAYMQQNLGFDYGFLVPLISMIIALIIFVLAKGRYRHVHNERTNLTRPFSFCVQCCNGCRNPNFDHARKRHGGGYDDKMVDGIKSVVRVLPIFGFLIIYWAVYSQMSTSLFLQSERMNISVGRAEMPVAILNIFNTLIILVLIPIMDRGVYPLLAKFGKSPTHLQRIGFGMILAACGMLYAAIIEIVRKDNIAEFGPHRQELAGDWFNASELSMFAQVPSFAFIGSSEVFASISGFEFAYTQSPPFMQGLMMGLFLMTSGLGSYDSTAIVFIVNAATNADWFPSEPNNGHLEYLLFLLAGLTLLNLVFFIFVAKHTKCREPETQVKQGIDEPMSVN